MRMLVGAAPARPRVNSPSGSSPWERSDPVDAGPDESERRTARDGVKERACISARPYSTRYRRRTGGSWPGA
jgi:hypothetical protein